MKNKLLLAAAAVLIMCMAITAYADDEKYNRAYEMVSAVAGELNINDESELITKSDFIRLAVSAVCEQPENWQYNNCFSDVNSGEAIAPYVGYAVDNGIIDKGAKFYPLQNITYMNAFKIAVRMTGKKIVADSASGNGYYKAAVSCDIDDDLSMKSTNDAVTKRDAVIIVRNMLEAGYVENYFDKVKITNNEPTVMKKFRNIEKVEGAVLANEYTGLYSKEAKSDKGFINIDGEQYRYSGEKKLLGKRVTAYYTDLLSEKKALCVFEKENRNSELTIYADTIENSDRRRITYQADGIKKANLAEVYSVIYNGIAARKTDLAGYLSFKNKDGYITLLDNNGDGNYDVVFVNEVKYVYLSDVDAKGRRLIDKNSIENSIIFDEDADLKIYDTFYYGKTLVDMNELSAGFVIAVTVSEDESYAEAEVCIKEVSGKITGIGDDGELYIDNKEYKLSEYAKKNYSFENGKAGSFYLGIGGLIVAAETEDKTIKYGYIVRCKAQSGLGKKNVIRLFTEDGLFKSMYISKKVKIDGDSFKTEDELYKKVQSMESLDGVHALTRFSVNDAGEVIMLDLANVNASTIEEYEASINSSDNNNLTMYASLSNARFKYHPGTFEQKCRIGSNTKIFVIPSSAYRDDEAKYHIRTKDLFGNDQRYSITAYNVKNSALEMEACLYVGDSGASGVDDSSTSSHIFIKAFEGRDPDGMWTDKVKLWNQTDGFVEYYTNSSDVAEEIKTYAPGDIVRFSVTEGEITAVYRDFAYSTKKVYSTSVGSNCGYAAGKLYKIEGNTMSWLSPDFDFDNADKMTFNDITVAVVGQVIYCDIKRSGSSLTATVYEAPNAYSRSYENSGNAADYVVIREGNTDAYLAIVYREIN